MTRSIVMMACLVGAACAAAVDEKDKDPVKEKLFAAKVAYDKEMAQFRAQAGDWFDRREEAARKAGDKKLLDQVKEDRKGFDEFGALPKAAPAAIQQKHDRARKALESAYGEAIKAYVKAKKDDEAAAVEKELASFRKDAAPGAWAVAFSPGTYAQSYDEGSKSTIDLRKDGTFTRVKNGVESLGQIGFADGKLVLKCEHFVEVWTRAGGDVKIDHWSPPANYPNAKVSAKGTAVRAKD